MEYGLERWLVYKGLHLWADSPFIAGPGTTYGLVLENLVPLGGGPMTPWDVPTAADQAYGPGFPDRQLWQSADNSIAYMLVSGMGHVWPAAPFKINRAALRLAIMFEEFAGKPATHNPYDNLEYKGVPMSAAGKFVTAFFEIFDPNVTPQRVCSALAWVIKEMKRN